VLPIASHNLLKFESCTEKSRAFWYTSGAASISGTGEQIDGSESPFFAVVAPGRCSVGQEGMYSMKFIFWRMDGPR